MANYGAEVEEGAHIMSCQINLDTARLFSGKRQKNMALARIAQTKIKCAESNSQMRERAILCAKRNMHKHLLGKVGVFLAPQVSFFLHRKYFLALPKTNWQSPATFLASSQKTPGK